MADGHLVETEIKRICQISGLKSAVFQLILSSGEGGGGEGSCRPSEGSPRPCANFFRYI